jgi:hypothetical protein
MLLTGRKKEGQAMVTPSTREQDAALQAQYRASKAATERLWYRIHRDRISRRRKERYRTDPLYRAKIRARHTRKVNKSLS